MNQNNQLKEFYTKKYPWLRINKKGPKYRAKRRTQQVIKAIKKFYPQPRSILDLGAAEGLMLSQIKKEFPESNCIGLELFSELAALNKNPDIKIIQGNAQNIPFPDNFFDVIIAAAVIEHISNPTKMMNQIYKALRKNGVVIITTPNPFFDQIDSFFSFVSGKNQIHAIAHQETFSLRKIKSLFDKTRLKAIQCERFMISPIGFPFELKIEKILKILKLDFILINQIAVGQK